MTSDQRSMFGPAPEPSSRKAKALPKRQPQAAARVKIEPLSAADANVRDHNLACVRSARSRAKVGDMWLTGDRCLCGTETIKILFNVTPEGGMHSEVRCPKCDIEKP